MSAVIVLVLRILLTVCLYAFLIVVLISFLRELRRNIQFKENQHLPRISLRIEKTPSKSFSQLEVLVGRDAQNDLVLQDDTISARHARLFYLNNHWMVEDSQSTNGTFLNDEKILSATALVENDIIRCGKINISVNF